MNKCICSVIIYSAKLDGLKMLLVPFLLSCVHQNSDFFPYNLHIQYMELP